MRAVPPRVPARGSDGRCHGRGPRRPRPMRSTDGSPTPPTGSTARARSSTIDPDGSDPLRLTEHRGYDAQSDLSPDGTLIVFRRSPALTGFEVWRMTAEGSAETRMTFGLDLAAGAYARASPDGRPTASRSCSGRAAARTAPAPVFTMRERAGRGEAAVLQAVPALVSAAEPGRDAACWSPRSTPRNRREDRAVESPSAPGRAPGTRRSATRGHALRRPEERARRVRLGRQLVARRHARSRSRATSTATWTST